jgi:hypothetical protein
VNKPGQTLSWLDNRAPYSCVRRPYAPSLWLLGGPGAGLDELAARLALQLDVILLTKDKLLSLASTTKAGVGAVKQVMDLLGDGKCVPRELWGPVLHEALVVVVVAIDHHHYRHIIRHCHPQAAEPVQFHGYVLPDFPCRCWLAHILAESRGVAGFLWSRRNCVVVR